MSRNSLVIIAAVVTFQIFVTVTKSWAFDQTHQGLTTVLGEYVIEGSVDYKGLKTDPSGLKQYLTQTSSVTKNEFNNWSKNDQLAFLINVYNAETLDLIIENYPVKSIKDIDKDSGGPWEQPYVDLFGDKITLNALEHEVIRVEYPEPRVHFALVCAAKGCPVLIKEAYTGTNLENQLETQTKIFLSDSDKNSIDTENKLLQLSPLFDWFSEDFIKQSGSVIDYVNPYFGGKAAPDFKIEYTFYDWDLNDNSK